MLFRRFTRRAACVAAAFAILPVATATATEIDIDPQSRHIGSHVRGTTPAINKLIARGVKSSKTFASIVEQLNKSNVIVYLQVTRHVPVGLDGRLGFMSAAGPLRYLHAQVREGLPMEQLLATAAHELQHALEVAQHDEVRDTASLAALYQRIGVPGHMHKRFDTTAARDAGRRVRQELS